MTPSHLRLFAAISIPAMIRDELIAVQNELRPLAAPRDVRWTSPEQLHLTLKFLGNVAAPLVDDVKKSLAVACAGNALFSMRVRGVGFFPNEHSPRVIWAGFDDVQNALFDLQSRVADQLAPFAENANAEKFLPHVTLGRFQKFRHHKTEKLLDHAKKFEGRLFGGFHAQTVELFRSETLPGGARHTSLAAIALG